MFYVTMAFATAAMAATSEQPTFVAPMATLYEEACLRTFPDDDALDALMAAKAVRPLTADEVKVTLRDDPGRGWMLNVDGRRAILLLELPPYHACSVRWSAPEGGFNLAPYRLVAERYKATHPGSYETRDREGEMDRLHIHSTLEGRRVGGNGADVLMVFDQHLKDVEAHRRRDAEMDLRFVHQITPDR